MAFVEGLCKIAKKHIDFSKFETNLEKFLKNEKLGIFESMR